MSSDAHLVVILAAAMAEPEWRVSIHDGIVRASIEGTIPLSTWVDVRAIALAADEEEPP